MTIQPSEPKFIGSIDKDKMVVFVIPQCQVCGGDADDVYADEGQYIVHGILDTTDLEELLKFFLLRVRIKYKGVHFKIKKRC